MKVGDRTDPATLFLGLTFFSLLDHIDSCNRTFSEIAQTEVSSSDGYKVYSFLLIFRVRLNVPRREISAAREDETKELSIHSPALNH